MIELSNVSKQYEDEVTAVDQLSFTVRKGETFGLVGTSGCGKTTTLKMINRLVEPTSGKITINGKLNTEQPPEQLRRGIGYVIQNVGLFPHYSVEENIAITPELLDWNASRIKKQSCELLDLVGLNPAQIADRNPAALSGGQQQRVGLARALAADPPIILMDEPFGGVDPITKEQIQKKFKELLRRMNKTVVLVTHDVFEAFDLCDRLCLMDHGQAQQTGTLRELLFHPANSFVHSFFDEHRLQLQMMSVTVEDILTAISSVSEQSSSKKKRFDKNQRKEDDKTIHLNDSFYSVFENMGSGGGVYRILNADDKIVGGIKAENLLSGFQAACLNLKEEGNG
jgi:osmoprotectant transport system ATP-binding protein